MNDLLKLQSLNRQSVKDLSISPYRTVNRLAIVYKYQ